jgi:hypothetical protein
LADHALFKMVLRPLRPELDGQYVEFFFPRRHVLAE